MGDTANTSSEKLNAAKVFVSYAREDKEFARQLSFALEDKGFGALMDVRAIVPGENWQLRLLNLIDQSTSIVVVLTDAYLNSEACGWELTEAEQRGKRMLCVLPQRLTEGGKVPDVLARDQHIFFYPDSEVPDSGFYDGVRKLEMGLRQNLDWLTLQRRYELLADEWRNGKSETGLLIGSALTEARAWSARPPEKMRVPDEVAAFIAASEKAEVKRQSKAKRDRIISTALTALGALLLVAAIYFGVDATRQRRGLAEVEKQRVDLLDANALLAQDTDIALKAAKLFAAGRSELSTYRSLRKLEADRRMEYGAEGNAGAAIQAVSYLEQATTTMEKLSPDGVGRFEELADDIRRDLAGAYFSADGTSSNTLLDALIARERDLTNEDVTRQLAFDYVARAVYLCTDDARKARIGDDLAKAPDAIRALFLWQTVSTIASSKPVCAEARTAICRYAPDCPVAAAPGPVTSPGVPAVEDVDTGKQVVNYSDAQTTAYQVRELFLHVSNKVDYAAAERLKAVLEKTPDAAGNHYRVLGIQMVQSGAKRSVRYYYAPQEKQAADIASLIASVAGETRSERWSDPATYEIMSLAGRYDGLPPHRAEIWF